MDADLREDWSHSSSHPETHPARGGGRGERWGGGGGGVEGVLTEVSLDSSPACRWLGDTPDLRPEPLSDSYHRAPSSPRARSRTHTELIKKIIPVQPAGADSLNIFWIQTRHRL